jgi:predicted choloylglycine hydrolase
MCEKCDEIERTIRRFRQVQCSISDELTVQQARQTIVDLEAQKSLVTLRLTIPVTNKFEALRMGCSPSARQSC